MIPSDIKFEGNAAPPQWTDGADQVIEKGTNIRIKIKGIRSEVDKMYAVGTMKEVGSPLFWSSHDASLLTCCRIILALCRSSFTLWCLAWPVRPRRDSAADCCIYLAEEKSLMS